MRRSIKAALVHTLLLSYVILPEVLGQQFQTNNVAATGAFPNTYAQGNGFVNNDVSKGYTNFQTSPSTYMNSPLHGQYWTGNAQTYPQYSQHPQQYAAYGAYPQQYGAYGAYNGYAQNGAYYPQQYYQQPYGQYGQSGYYPGFDAQYWSGNYHQYPAQAYPGYHHRAPVYYHGAPMYPAYPTHHYPGHYPYKKRGFLSGTKHEKIAKTLLGAAVVGAVAGAVARGK